MEYNNLYEQTPQQIDQNTQEQKNIVKKQKSIGAIAKKIDKVEKELASLYSKIKKKEEELVRLKEKLKELL